MVKLNNDMTFQQRIQQQALLGNMDMYVARAKLYNTRQTISLVIYLQLPLSMK